MKTTPICIAVFAGLAFTAACVFAQTAAPPPPPETPPPAALPFVPSVPLAPPPPIVDPALELKGSALVAALRKGGLVLYMRHAETGVVTEKCEQSNLSTIG